MIELIMAHLSASRWYLPLRLVSSANLPMAVLYSLNTKNATDGLHGIVKGAWFGVKVGNNNGRSASDFRRLSDLIQEVMHFL